MRAGGASGVVGGRMGCCEPGPVYIPCSGAGRSRPASSHRIGRWLTRAPAAAPAPAAVVSAAPSSAATSPISRPATMPQTQGTSAGHATKTSEAGFLPWTGRRARAGRTLSSSSNRSFVFATPETPGWKGGIGLPKALHAMWSPVSLFTTCVVPTTWFTQMTGCCRRPLFGDLRRWRDQRRSSWGGMDLRQGAGRAHRCRSKPATDLSREARHGTLSPHKNTEENTKQAQRSAASFSWHGVGGHSGWAWGTGATVRAPHLSHSRVSHVTQLSLELRCTCTQFGSDLKRRVWGLVASRLALTMISIKGATALATALATAAIIPAAALAFVLVLPWGVEDIIRADDLV